MMAPVHRIVESDACPCEGQVKLSPSKLSWTGGMIVAFLVCAPFHTTLPAIITGLALAYVTLLLGHSVGMHRMMIHQTFKTPRWLRIILIYIGVLVGIGGPRGIIEIHDTRDWAQRLPKCHDYFSHTRGFWRDLTWQLFYKFEFQNRPRIEIEDEIAKDSILQCFDKTWRWHQLILALILYSIGGFAFVVWGVFFRVALSTIGHWSVTWVCHNPGPGKWDVDGAGVQASNLNLAGWLTHGECWHNNHHAFPESAQIGLDDGQTDPAWWIIAGLEKMGLATHVGRPRPEKARDDLKSRNPLFPKPRECERADV